jgi:hypothetical protein
VASLSEEPSPRLVKKCWEVIVEELVDTNKAFNFDIHVWYPYCNINQSLREGGNALACYIATC